MASNVQSTEELTTEIRSLQLEVESTDEDEQLMLDFTTDLARTIPSILEGNYDARLVTVIRLSKSSTELLTKKSRRLAGLKPTLELKDDKEQKRLEWNMIVDKKEKVQEEGETRKKADKEIREDTEEY